MNNVIFGDCRDSMRAMIADGVKVQTCVTSPPYFGLRDYGHPGQLGLETTPAQYVANMVEVFGLVRELLADDGTLWLNLGDSYVGSGPSSIGRNDAGRNFTGGGGNIEGSGNPGKQGMHKRETGLKHKDLIGIPWRVAFALQADGWYLRQDIIWAKPNPMPESVTDRCTKSHEYIFLMSKSPRYFYDHEAIKEPSSGRDPGNLTHKMQKATGIVLGRKENPNDGLVNIGAVDDRNKRSVWTVATTPYKGAHFATFPPALIEPCILAGSRPGDIVFDPFIGSGTTGQVAQELGRRWLGCELNEAYAPLQNERTSQSAMELV